MRFVFAIATFFFFGVLFAPKVLAENEFIISYDVHYDVNDSGITKITQQISLKNQTNKYYASEYRLAVRNKEIKNVVAKDGIGELPVTVNKSDVGYEIHVTFNEKIVGSGKVLRWNLSYELPDAAKHNGSIWEVAIPGIVQSETIGNYSITLVVPRSFGDPSFLSPQPSKIDGADDTYQYRFDQEIVTKSGVSAIFGNVQRFSFSLTYHLANPNLVPVYSEIALPPDTAYQNVIYTDVTPHPRDVRVDEDGNYIAKYELARGQKMDVKASGVFEIKQVSKRVVVPLTDVARRKYLEPQRYWEVTNPLVLEKAKELNNPRSIYQFVTQYLTYDQDRLNGNKIERLGAVTSLSRPNNAVCMEYTDLFIALARAAGVPAREVNGFAYTSDARFRPVSLKNNADILHSWPEYWSEEDGWVPVDPTWGSTTGGVNYFDQMDFNHIAFAIHGYSSTMPYPAGAYKYDSNQGPDITVQFAKDKPLGESHIEISLAIAQNLTSGLEGSGKVIVRNSGNIATSAGTIELKSSGIKILGPESVLVGIVPAYANREIEFVIKSDGWLQHITGEVNARLGRYSSSAIVHVQPLPLFQLLPWIGGIIGGTTLVFVGYFAVERYRRRRLARADANSATPDNKSAHSA